GLELARRSPAIVEVRLTAAIGTDLRLQNSFRDRLGYLISTGEDGPAAAHDATEALAHLRLRIEPRIGPPVTKGVASQ
ncbi:MAG: hypothetical protein ABI140_14630, partial [Jatrophihabitantaceae bacterium]